MDQSIKDLRYQSSKALSQMTNHIKHVKSEGFIVHTFKTLHIEFYEKNANGSFLLVPTQNVVSMKTTHIILGHVSVFVKVMNACICRPL